MTFEEIIPRFKNHELLALLALEKLRKDFENMSYDEKLKLYEKYPDLITIVE